MKLNLRYSVFCLAMSLSCGTNCLYAQNEICQTVSRVSFEGYFKGEWLYRQQNMTLGMFYLNPFVSNFSHDLDLDSIVLDLEVYFEGKLRDSVTVVEVETTRMGLWEYLAGNRFYRAERYLGKTEKGKLKVKVKNSKELKLMFFDANRCVDIIVLEILKCSSKISSQSAKPSLGNGL